MNFFPRRWRPGRTWRKPGCRELMRSTFIGLRSFLLRVQQLSESNPMMGLRGCRLGIVHPEIVVMQVRAILRAALRVKAEGHRSVP